MHKGFIALIICLTAAIVGCTAPGHNNDYGPEIVLDDTVHAFIEGVNQHDLSQFDSYFAPPDVANPNGLLHTRALAHQLFDTVPSGATIKLDKWNITNDYPVVNGDPVVSYQATVSLWQGDTQLWTAEVTQDVTLHFMSDGLWKIVSADPPVINGNTYEPPPQDVNVPANWATYTNDLYKISYPVDLFTIDGKDPGQSMVTFSPAPDALKASPDSTFYRVTVAARSNDTQAAVSGAYDPASLFGQGPALTYGPEEIQGKTIQEISLDGSTAYRIDNLDGLGITTDIVALRNDVVYEIVVEPFELGKANLEEYLPVVDQVISTFQFAQ